MHTMTLRNRQGISMLLVVSMLISTWLAVPMPVKAGILGSVGNIAKAVVVNGGALVAGYMGGVLGMALGGGPIGMVAGGVGGFILGKKVLGWATSSFANVATVAGAVAGGVLLAGAGLPLLLAGVVGGALLGRGLVTLIKKLTGKSASIVQITGVNKEEDKQSQEFMNYLAHSSGTNPAAAPAAAAPAITQSVQEAPANGGQDAYNKYLASYRAYMDATQKGNSELAKSAYIDYQKNLTAYQASMSGS